MTRNVFRDFDDFADAINGVAGRFVPTGRPQTDWWHQAVPIGRLAVQQLQTGSAATFIGDGRDRALTIGIPISLPAHIRIDGDALDQQSFILVKEQQPFTFAANQATRWAGITVPLDHPALAPELLEEIERGSSSSDATRAKCEPAYVTAMRLMVSRVCAGHGLLSSPVAARALEEEIAGITLRALEASSRAEPIYIGRPRHDRDRVIGKVLELIEAVEGKPLLMQDLSQATEVSERALRYIFQEYFGVSPMKLLKLRQLHELRAALLAADPRSERVADIAARFGVWDLSLFARNYKALYGEVPSDTLRRAPFGAKHGTIMNATWLQFAARRFARTTRTRIIELPELRVAGGAG